MRRCWSTCKRDGRTIKSLIHPGRDCIFWVLERSPTRSTSSPAGRSFTPKSGRASSRRRGRPIVDPAHKPAIGKTVTFCPSLWGGKDWPSAAYSPKTGFVYMPANENFCGGLPGEKVPLDPGKLWLGTNPRTSA